MTQALKKDVHAWVDEHICTSATCHCVPMCVLVLCACMHERLRVCGVEGKVKWTEPRFVAARLRTLRLRERTQSTARPLQKADGEDKDSQTQS